MVTPQEVEHCLERKVPNYRLFLRVQAGANAVLCLLMLGSGVGLLFMQMWGRDLALFYALLSFIVTILSAVWTFTDRDTSARVLGACPSAEWRLTFALSRFGGLRCPSEHMALEWADVNWEKGEFLVRSPKTGNRRVPLFPELRPYLEEAFELAPEGATHVLRRYRNPAKDLRSGFLRILRRAGVSPWPRLFHNLRATRETELAAEYPLHVVCAWIGNTERIAQAHYLQVTDDYFQRAAGGAAESGAVSPEKALQNPVRQPAAPGRTGPQGGPNSPGGCELVREGASWINSLQDIEMTPRGFEPGSARVRGLQQLCQV
jgi:Phage integrase family